MERAVFRGKDGTANSKRRLAENALPFRIQGDLGPGDIGPEDRNRLSGISYLENTG